MIYEYDCEDDGVFEVYKSSWKDKKQEEACPRCGKDSTSIPSVPNISPDTFWSGKYVDNLGQHFSSRDSYREYLRRRSLVPDEPGVREQIAGNKKAAELKEDKERHDFIAEQVKHF